MANTRRLQMLHTAKRLATSLALSLAMATALVFEQASFEAQAA
jgi:hypothetical protein